MENREFKVRCENGSFEIAKIECIDGYMKEMQPNKKEIAAVIKGLLNNIAENTID